MIRDDSERTGAGAPVLSLYAFGAPLRSKEKTRILHNFGRHSTQTPLGIRADLW